MCSHHTCVSQGVQGKLCPYLVRAACAAACPRAGGVEGSTSEADSISLSNSLALSIATCETRTHAQCEGANPWPVPESANVNWAWLGPMLSSARLHTTPAGRLAQLTAQLAQAQARKRERGCSPARALLTAQSQDGPGLRRQRGAQHGHGADRSHGAPIHKHKHTHTHVRQDASLRCITVFRCIPVICATHIRIRI